MAELHIITSEYPPQVGGVSDYTKLVAEGLAEAGDEVNVWCPSEGQKAESTRQKAEGGKQEADGRRQAADEQNVNSSVVTHYSSRMSIHREFGKFRPRDLRRVSKQLDQFAGPRRLLVQWVPHGYGFRSMNLWFCGWLWWRAKFKSDRVELMVHEPFLAFGEGSRKQDIAAAVHRLMTMIILNAASGVWVSIPAWERRLRPYALGRRLSYKWVPIASNVGVVTDPVAVRTTRCRYAHNGNPLIGHFGTGERHVKELLLTTMISLLSENAYAHFLLMGRESDNVLKEFTEKAPQLIGHVQATGWLPPDELSLHVSACDLMLQPYPDGISSRRTSAMVGLSHGTPVITTVGHLTEPMWGESNAVALASVEDVDNLSRLTAGLLSDSTERKRMAVLAKRLYRERFDIKHTIKALRAGLT